jgi:RHS repeat-associated protein
LIVQPIGIQYDIITYTWDHRNRLTRVEFRTTAGGEIAKSASYTYDALDRRIVKTVDPDGAGPNPATIERYVYDRDHIWLCFDGNNTLTNRYLYGPALDMALADERSTTAVRWMLTDNQGTVRDITNNVGGVQNHLRYDSFGRITSQTNANFNTRFNYTGREFDAETGLYFYRSRYYDPGVGRFIGEDSIGFGGGDANLYRYVGNSPVNWIDLFGYRRVPIRTPIPNRRFPTVAPPPSSSSRPPSLTIPCISAPGSPCIPKRIPPPQRLDPNYWLTDPASPLRLSPPFLNLPKIKKCPPRNDIPMGKKDKWTCKASCNVQQIDRTAYCPDRSTGMSSGPSEQEACENAKRVATQSTPRGCYPRHCKCACMRN